jgi:hypothetical protein
MTKFTYQATGNQAVLKQNTCRIPAGKYLPNETCC